MIKKFSKQFAGYKIDFVTDEDVDNMIANPEAWNNIVEIGENAFRYVTRHSSIVIPETVKKIGAGAFQHSSFENVKISRGVKEIGPKAFYGTRIKVVQIPDSVETIGAWAFAWCENIKNITIPKSVKEVGSFAFAHSGIEHAEIKDSKTRFCKGIFYGCKNMKFADVDPQQISKCMFAEIGSVKTIIAFCRDVENKHIGNMAYSNVVNQFNQNTIMKK